MVRIALAQINAHVGDIAGNRDRVREAIERAGGAGAQVIALPELALTGYPPDDLLLKRSFVEANRRALQEIAAITGDCVAIVGFVDRDRDRLYNAAAICHRGETIAVYRKQELPNYGVFDERRYFEPGHEHVLVDIGSAVIGVCVCEDAWRADGPIVGQGDAGAQVVVNINASPFQTGKVTERLTMLAERAQRADASIAYVNCVGGQDELLFDGASLVVDPRGELVARLPQFEEAFVVVDVPLGRSRQGHAANVRKLKLDVAQQPGAAPSPPIAPPLMREQEIYEALRLALRDYVRKNDFDKVVIGLSGGIDSTLTATIACDALESRQVLGVAMPSEFSSSHSVEDAKQLAANLDIELVEMSITRTFQAYLDTLKNALGATQPGVAEENLQARIRGNLLMAISNRYGHLVVATGNKSELACGYATLYGDMAGGFALLKDVFKTDVYALARYRNSISTVIPERVLAKPPSAELRPDQKDADSLPPYDVLDPILDAYIEDDLDIAEIAAQGFERELVERVVAMVDRAEYKRRQAPPGPKVTTKAFGRDRRLPITNAWRHAADRELPDKVTGEK